MSWLLINKIIRPPIVIKIANYFQHGAGLERDLRSRIKAQHSTFFLMSFFIIYVSNYGLDDMISSH